MLAEQLDLALVDLGRHGDIMSSTFNKCRAFVSDTPPLEAPDAPPAAVPLPTYRFSSNRMELLTFLGDEKRFRS